MYRKVITRPLPPSAVVLGDGTAKLKSGRVVELNENGMMKCLSSKYYARVNGREKALEVTKRDSELKKAELVAVGPLQEKGLLVTPQAKEDRELAPLAEEWLTELEHAGRNQGHVNKLRIRIFKILTLTGFQQLNELATQNASDRISKAIASLRVKKQLVEITSKEDEFTPNEVRHLFAISQSALSKFANNHGITGNGKAGKAKRYSRQEVERIASLKARGRSPNTVNGHAVATSAFCNWLKKRGLLDKVPYMPLRADEKTDRRKVRRAITWAECKKLAVATEKLGKEFIRGQMRPSERAALYLTAFASMLRARALRELRPSDCHLKSGKPWLQIRAETDKTGTSRAIPLPAEVAAKLAVILRGKDKNQPIWNMPLNMAPVVRADLRNAGMSIETKDGAFDMHAFRHAGATHLALKGVPLDTIAKIGGWANLQQFFSRYGHYSVGGLANATKGAW